MFDQTTQSNHPNEPVVFYEHGNALALLDKYTNRKFDLVITSPPYNIGKEYETKKTIEKYLADQENIISKIVDLISSDGSICWQVGNLINEKNKEIFPLDIFYYHISSASEPVRQFRRKS
jgi:adenine-specific DNA-methyltransferase